MHQPAGRANIERLKRFGLLATRCVTGLFILVKKIKGLCCFPFFCSKLFQPFPPNTTQRKRQRAGLQNSFPPADHSWSIAGIVFTWPVAPFAIFISLCVFPFLSPDVLNPNCGFPVNRMWLQQKMRLQVINRRAVR